MISPLHDPYMLTSLVTLIMSLLLFIPLRRRFSLPVRISLIGGALLSLIASVVPSINQILAVSFLPSLIYNVTDPMTMAPYIVGLIGFIGCWSIITLAQELFAIFHRSSLPPRLMMTGLAVILFAIMTRAIHHGTSDYTFVLNSQEISNYALEGTDPQKLSRIYHDVTLTNNEKLQDEILSLLSENTQSSSDLLRKIYDKIMYANMDPNFFNIILINLTKNPNTPSDLLEKLLVSASKAHDVPTSSLAAIPRNPHFSETMLLQLAYYPNCEIRRAIIAYPQISESILKDIITKDPDVGVRRDAKRRLDFLHGLSHLDERKRPPVTIVASLDRELQQLAAHSFDTQKLHQIYHSSEVLQNPGFVLENLAGNCYIDEALVRQIFSKTIASRTETHTGILVALASNPKTPADILTILSKQNDLAILRALASNPNLPYALLSKLAPYPDCKIRKKIICHPDTSGDIIARLLKDPDQSVSLETNTRLKEADYYLETCREVEKMNPSCQKFFDEGLTAFPLLPNTSKRNEEFERLQNMPKKELSLNSSSSSL